MEPILITCPRLRSTIPGSTARVIYTRPLLLVSIMSSQSSTLARCAGSRPSASPALLTRISISRHSAGRLAMVSSMAARLRTSNCTVRTLSPNSSLSAFKRSLRRPVAITLCPLAIKRRVMLSPKPAVAPVTSTIISLFLQRVSVLSTIAEHAVFNHLFCNEIFSFSKKPAKSATLPAWSSA